MSDQTNEKLLKGAHEAGRNLLLPAAPATLGTPATTSLRSPLTGLLRTARPGLLTALAGLALAIRVCADETLPQLKVGREMYTNVTVTMVTATDIAFNHSRGMSTAKLKYLEPAMQKHFGYDPEKAGQAELSQKEANAQYRAKAASDAPVRAATADSSADSAAPSSQLIWYTDLPGALQKAADENKCVLLLFDGSDWCPASEYVYRTLVAKEDFRTYAREKLVLVLVDFPRNIPQTEALKEANARLKTEFNIRYYPAFVLLDSEGKRLGGTLGTEEISSRAFVNKLERFRDR